MRLMNVKIPWIPMLVVSSLLVGIGALVTHKGTDNPNISVTQLGMTAKDTLTYAQIKDVLNKEKENNKKLENTVSILKSELMRADIRNDDMRRTIRGHSSRIRKLQDSLIVMNTEIQAYKRVLIRNKESTIK